MMSSRSIRHTSAIESIRNNINPRTLQMALGQDHLTTTEIYFNLSPEDMLREYREKW